MNTENKQPTSQPDPDIISGGMGVRISWWVMARIVSMMGGLGVVSGTALEIVYPRILQDGDPGGNVKRAFTELVRRQPSLAGPVWELFNKYYIEGGRAPGAPYKPVSPCRLTRIENFRPGPDSFWELPREMQVLVLAASFAEVWLAKEGHDKPVGINFLRKVERPLPWALYGAMLAGAAYVLVGAGSPDEMPAMIEKLSRHEPAAMSFKVYGSKSDTGNFYAAVRPETLLGAQAPDLRAPKFLAIVSSFGLASALAGNPATRPYGFVVEGSEAGGHSAAPAKMRFDAAGQPLLVYTDQDKADIGAIAGIGLPFWLAGSFGSPARLREARALGASGVQIGTLAALSGQSGTAPALRAKVMKLLAAGKLKVANTMISPTGFPFKVAQVPGTISDESVYRARERRCDIGLLLVNYLTPGGGLGYRCPAEPVDAFTAKGGRVQNTVGRVCLCNALLAAAGFPQLRPGGYEEPPVVTLGENLDSARDLLATLPPGQETYTIGKAMLYLRGAS
ncbi:MAG: nitronate monooxygenase [Elusimicrobiota bacterium]|nr:nitronate monooxygenase [Elusimicrobiota bacterium]